MTMCSEGYYGHKTQRKCLKCDKSCRTCANGISPNRCTSCPDSKYLFDEKCLDKCNQSQVATVPLIRLAGSRPVNNEGRVEVYIDGTWKTLCGYHMSLVLANVICRQLSMGYAISYDTKAKFGRGTGSVFNGFFNCKGKETSVFQCSLGYDPIGPWRWPPSTRYRYRRCYGHSRDVGVSCSKLPTQAVGNQCVTVCPEYFYKSTKNTCMPCNNRCKKCKDRNTCYTCKEEFFLKEKVCVESCGYKMYGDLDSRECKDCDMKVCKSCNNWYSNKNCSACQNSLISNDGNCIKSCSDVKKYQSGSKCVTECPNHYYKNTTGDNCVYCRFPHKWDQNLKKCILCPDNCDRYSCQRLNGTSSAICNKCAQGYFLLSDKKTCSKCASSCKSCNATATQCTSCTMPLYLRHSACVQKCEGGYEQVRNGGRECVKPCSTGYFLNSTTNKCDKCNSSCLTCKSNKDNCETCPANKYLQCALTQVQKCPSFSNTCVRSCSRGFFLEPNKIRCSKCDPSCATCVNTTTLCTSCKPPLAYLRGTSCSSNCSGLYKSKFSTKIRLVGGRSAFEGRVEVQTLKS